MPYLKACDAPELIKWLERTKQPPLADPTYVPACGGESFGLRFDKLSKRNLYSARYLKNMRWGQAIVLGYGIKGELADALFSADDADVQPIVMFLWKAQRNTDMTRT